ncbi:hypothetical protein ACUN9Y_16035 [Halomonas sp. V046]|uniref:hypothetical protein n=1 Tax=Halomonas sp. V046 TaxID=3459611 RepID=UPI004043CE51
MSFLEMSDDALWQIANPLMDHLMEASAQRDHGEHCRDFTERMKAIVTPEHLLRVCEAYQREKGHFTEREPVAVFKRADSVALVWRQRFSHADGDFVAEMVLVHRNGRYLVDHAMVF